MSLSLRVYSIQKCEMCGMVIGGEPVWERIRRGVEHLFCSKKCAKLYQERHFLESGHDFPSRFKELLEKS